MNNNQNTIDHKYLELIPRLLQLQSDFEKFFLMIDISYETIIIEITKPDNLKLPDRIIEIKSLLMHLNQATHEIASINLLMNYREFGSIVVDTIPLLERLIQLLPHNFPAFYQDSHPLLKYYWGIRYLIARFELESIPEYYCNQALFFNIPDNVFTFLEGLKDGPQPVTVLADVDLEVRIHKSLPLFLSRTPDEITLSPLGEKYFTVHAISEFYFYYLYDFGENLS